MLSTALSALLTTVHAIADFANSPRVGWVGMAVIPYAVFNLVYPLTRKCPDVSSTTTHEGEHEQTRTGAQSAARAHREESAVLAATP